MKLLALFALFVPCVLVAACGGGANTANQNINTNTNIAVTLDNANLPAGLSTSPLPLSDAQTPGIPANVNAVPRGSTPTPGIPSEQELRKGVQRGATPTPGIPSEAEMRKQMGMPAANPKDAAASSDARPEKRPARNSRP